MDNSKHTVTIPIADYNELLGAKDSGQAALAHFELLAKNGVEVFGFLDITKKPKRCNFRNNGHGANMTFVIQFEY